METAEHKPKHLQEVEFMRRIIYTKKKKYQSPKVSIFKGDFQWIFLFCLYDGVKGTEKLFGKEGKSFDFFPSVCMHT